MKKYLIGTIAFVASVAWASSTFTSNYLLEKPQDGSTSWGTAIRNAFDTIDAQMHSNAAGVATSVQVTGNQTVAGVKTFTSPINATGGVTGNVIGNVTGNLTGNVTGNVTGNTNGTHTGPVVGNVSGNVTGDLTGNVTGNVTGNTAGTHTGPVVGNVSGNLTGNVSGNVTGALTGPVTGNVTGNLTGNVTGNVTGSTGVFTTSVTTPTLVNTGTLTLPTSTDTIVGRATTDTLTNKTIAAGSNTISGIADGNISSSAAIARSKIAAGTASQVVVNDGSGLLSGVATLPVSQGGTGSNTQTAFRAVATDVSGNIVSSSATATELGYLSGVTAGIQSQINSLSTGSGFVRIAGDTMTGGLTTPSLNVSGATASRALVTDASKNVVSSTVTSTELGYVSGATSSLQTQLNGKEPTQTKGSISTSTTGVTVGSGSSSTVGPNVTVDVQTASGTQPGLLAAADFATFAAKQAAGNYLTGTSADVTSAGPGVAAATVNSVGGSTAALVHSAELAANAATDANTVSTIVKRDGSGNFTAGTITAAITGAASSNVLKAGDTMTGVLQLTNGVVGTPALNFGDTASGIYRSALNEVAISSNGTQVVKFAGGGATFNTALFATGQYKGNTGGTVTAPVFVPHNSATNSGIYAPNSGDVAVTTSGSERIRITSGGNILVGTTTNGTGLLQVNGVASLAAGTVSAPAINFSDAGTGIYRNGTNILGIANSGNLTAQFNASGNMQVGTTSPIAFTAEKVTAQNADSSGGSSSYSTIASQIALNSVTAYTAASTYASAWNRLQRTTTASVTDTASMGAAAEAVRFNVSSAQTLTNTSSDGVYGLLIQSGSNQGAGTLALTNYSALATQADSLATGGTKYGLNVGSVTGGTTNYAIKTGSGQVNIGDTTASTSTTTGSLVVGGGMGVAGAVSLPAGLIGSPSINFNGDSTLGFYYSTGAGGIGLVQGGNTRVLLTATGRGAFTSNGSTAFPTLAIGTGWASSGAPGLTTTGTDMLIATGAAARIRITSAGNVLVGTTADSATGTLQVSGGVSLNGATSGTVAIAAPATAGTQAYTLPTAVPASNGQALTSTTAGVMSWATPGSVFALAAKTTTYTITSSDDVVTGDASGGAFTMTLPTAVGATGKVYNIKKIDSSANALTVATTSAQTIDGASSAILKNQNESLEVISNGTNWYILRTSTFSGDRIERVAIANSGSASVSTQSGPWVSSVTRNSTGSITINIATSVFSATPSCACNVRDAGGAVACSIDTTSTPSATLIRVLSFVTSTAAAVDKSLEVICMGAR